MGRASTAKAVRSLPARARKIMPDVTLRTTCLLGFPGEKEAHFKHLLEYLGEAQFDHVGVFTYSPEENTRACDMPGRPDAAVAERRRRRLMLAQKEIVDRKAVALVGIDTDVMLENAVPGGSGVWMGRSQRYAPRVDGSVFVDQVGREATPGTFVRARYTEPRDYDMKARCIGR
jgi:ribosomal protein S12 methylthiotransferase